MKLLSYLILFAIVLNPVFSYLQAQCIYTLKPHSGKDAEIFSMPCNLWTICETTNLGTNLTLMSSTWTWNGNHASIRSVLEFDLSSFPVGSTVSNATLKLYNPGTVNTQWYHCGENTTIHPCISNDFEIHRITQPWDENTITWVNQPLFASAIPGVDMIYLPNNDMPYNHFTIDITDMVNFWLANPSQNHGMLMKQINEAMHYHSAVFASSDCSDSTLHPELILTMNQSNCNNHIEGYIFDDQNGDCVLNGTDQGLENWIVEIQPGPIYASTNSAGYYNAIVPDGSYTVSQQLPNAQIWDAACPLPYTHQVTVSGGNTVAADFAVEAEVYCPILTVDIGYSFLRVCHSETFIVSYCNNGNQPAQGVYVDVNFSNGLTPLSASIPHTVNSSNQWSFSIGTLAPGDCGSFYISAMVDCNANFGDYECVTATILPYFPCSEPSQDTTVTWDRSSVSVSGYCDNDSLACFTIINNGSASNGYMQGSSNYRIYDNNVLVHSGTFQLAGGADTVICWPVGAGHTIRLEADQRPGHPGNSHPNAVVGNCGVSSFLFNFETDAPEDDAAANVAHECAEVRASFDPNDKQVIPSGIGSQHFVEKNTMLDYKIRFQNTGNDTAFTVIITDELSPNLDINSIQLGASSHNYTFSVEGNRILKFTFNNIMLPDSNVNEPLSHGFVKFKVNQVPDLPIGTVINNSANIFFDFNAPVLTNNTFLTIGDPALMFTGLITPNLGSSVEIKAYPNPFSQMTTISIENFNSNDAITFELYNTLGEVVQTIKTFDKQFDVQRQGLSSGVYFYTVRSNKKQLGSGKLIVE